MNGYTALILFLIMGIFNNCSSQKDKKYIYLAGWEVEFNGDEECEKFMKTQAIDKETAKNVWSSIELIYVNNKLAKAFDREEVFKEERTLNNDEIGLEYEYVVPNKIFSLIEATNSTSYLGGEAPPEFTIPKFDFNAPFQYLGKFSRSEAAFNWLPFDLHLVAPLYLNFDKLFIDYSDPLNPQVYDVEKLKQTDTAYEDIKPDSEVVYRKVYFTSKESKQYGNGFGHTGVPNWIQYPEIPICPKTNKIMKFLVQLTYDGANIPTEKSNIKPEKEMYKPYFQKMNFWGDGDLFIFFEPDSKIACFLIQNT